MNKQVKVWIMLAFSSIVGNKDTHGLNSKRLAEVWMDDYKRLFYMHRKDLIVCIYPLIKFKFFS